MFFYYYIVSFCIFCVNTNYHNSITDSIILNNLLFYFFLTVLFYHMNNFNEAIVIIIYDCTTVQYLTISSGTICRPSLGGCEVVDGHWSAGVSMLMNLMSCPLGQLLVVDTAEDGREDCRLTAGLGLSGKLTTFDLFLVSGLETDNDAIIYIYIYIYIYILRSKATHPASV